MGTGRGKKGVWRDPRRRRKPRSRREGRDATRVLGRNKRRGTHIQILQQIDLGLPSASAVSRRDGHRRTARTIICPISLFGILLS